MRGLALRVENLGDFFRVDKERERTLWLGGVFRGASLVEAVVEDYCGRSGCSRESVRREWRVAGEKEASAKRDKRDKSEQDQDPVCFRGLHLQALQYDPKKQLFTPSELLYNPLASMQLVLRSNSPSQPRPPHTLYSAPLYTMPRPCCTPSNLTNYITTIQLPISHSIQHSILSSIAIFTQIPHI